MTRTLELKVIKVSQPIGEFYIASLPCKDVAEISYTDVRRIEQRDLEKYLGVQRPLKKDRVQALKQYVETTNATFPTSVLLAVDVRCAELNTKTMTLTLSEYIDNEDDSQNIPFSKIARIIDGQHRIAAFVDFSPKGKMSFVFDKDKVFDINVAIFIGADIPSQANIFSTVNLAQTKVNKSLAYDLAGLAKKRSPQKTCHIITVLLDSDEDSPFYKRIKRLGVKTEGRNFVEPLTQAVFVEGIMKFISSNPNVDRESILRKGRLSDIDLLALSKNPLRNLFAEGKDAEIATIFNEYFSLIREYWPKSWKDSEVSGNILPKSNAFKAFLRYLYDIYKLDNNLGEKLDRDDFKNYLSPLTFEDGKITSKEYLPGGGGEAAFYKHIKDFNSKK